MKFQVGDVVTYNGKKAEIIQIIIDDPTAYRIKLDNNDTRGVWEESLKKDEESEPGRIRWYKKGKLEENKIFENNKYSEGDLVIYNGKYYPDRVGEKCVVTGIGYKSQYWIKFLKDNTKHLVIEDLLLSNDEKTPTRIRWYKKGKLSERYLGRWKNENKIYEMRRSNMSDDTIIKKINPKGFLIRIMVVLAANRGNNVLVNYLKHHLLGKVTSFESLYRDDKGINQVARAGHWWIDDIYLDENKQVHMVGHGFYQTADNKYDVILYLKSDIEYEDKRITSDLDPYGEEDWNDDYMNESLNMDDIFIGMRVRCVDDYKAKNKIGTVVSYDIDSDNAGIEFDDQIDGHNCGGDAKEGHGWYVELYNLEPLEEDKPIRVRWYKNGKLVKDNFMIKSFHVFRNL
jgi:hypothetical protein